jgi:hypothetical protein
MLFDRTPGAITSRELDWLVRTIQIHTTATLGAPGEHTSAGLCIGAAGAAGAAAADARNTATTAPAEDSGAGRGYKLHICGFSIRLETSCGGISGGPEPPELQATQWRLRWRNGDVARRCRWRTGSRRTSGEPVAGVIDRRRSGQSSGTGSTGSDGPPSKMCRYESFSMCRWSAGYNS